MFGKKARKKPQEERPEGRIRIHGEGLGHVWAALTGGNPEHLVPQILATVLKEGGTRPAWQWQRGGQEYIMMAWPQSQPLRAGVLMGGTVGEKLTPHTVVPILEGFANDLEVEAVHGRAEGLGGDVAVNVLADQKPMWFFDPFYGRDREDLTPGVTHTFWLGAVALAVRKALLDDITITQGEQYESYAEGWLESHPGSSRTDVPPLKVDVRGKTIILPGDVFGEYKIRGKVEKVESLQLDKMPVKAMYLTFPLPQKSPLALPLFAAQCVLKDYDPQEGDEIEAAIWLQGRIIDLERGPEVSRD